MPITVTLQADGVHGVVEHTDSPRWREGDCVKLRQQAGRVELHLRGGCTHVCTPHFSTGNDGVQRATFDVTDRRAEESPPAVSPRFSLEDPSP